MTYCIIFQCLYNKWWIINAYQKKLVTNLYHWVKKTHEMGHYNIFDQLDDPDWPNWVVWVNFIIFFLTRHWPKWPNNWPILTHKWPRKRPTITQVTQTRPKKWPKVGDLWPTGLSGHVTFYFEMTHFIMYLTKKHWNTPPRQYC